MPYALLVLVLALLAGPAQAQIGNPGFMLPDTRFDEDGLPLPHQPNADDRLFAILAAEGNLAEVRLGELAAEKAASGSVKTFAQRMAEDHSAALEELKAIAAESGIALPEALHAEHQALLEQLEQLEGADFDLAYMRAQVVEHQKSTQLLIWEVDLGQDGALQRFAGSGLPLIIGHLEEARAITAQLTARQLALAEPPVSSE